MSSKKGWAAEHRAIFYDVYSGDDLFCEFCGKDWSFRPYYDHVDHIDEVKLNNAIENLRPLCNACNTGRTKKVYNKTVTWNGEAKTAQEWGRDDRIPVSGWCIRQRLSRGYSVESAFFAEKITHKNKIKEL